MSELNTSHYLEETYKLVMGGVAPDLVFRIVLSWGFTPDKASTMIRWATVKAKKLRWI